MYTLSEAHHSEGDNTNLLDVPLNCAATLIVSDGRVNA